jgi:hypothetical protein
MQDWSSYTTWSRSADGGAHGILTGLSETSQVITQKDSRPPQPLPTALDR